MTGPHAEDRGNDYVTTWIGTTEHDRITIAGRDLPTEIMGRLTLTELAYLLITRREATPAQRCVLDAVLVSLADHGFTPSSLSARLTYTGAPEAIQAAIAAGLLGAGSVFLGPAGDTAQVLSDALHAHVDAGGALDDGALTTLAERIVDDCLAAGRRVPGLGHPVHRVEDPRTPRLYELVEQQGLLGPHLRLLRAVAAVYGDRTGRRLPINGAGAGGAALADVGLPANSVRGFVLIARTAGLVAHLVEESAAPVGMPLWLEVERRASDTARDAIQRPAGEEPTGR